MLFNSPEFLLGFLPVVLAGYLFLAVRGERRGWPELVPVGIGRREDYGLDQSVWDELGRFVRWAEGHGVKVLAGYACTLDGDELRGAKADLGRARIREGFAELGVEVIGRGREALRAREDFFDTNYHLTAEGREQRTDELADLLKPVVEAWKARW